MGPASVLVCEDDAVLLDIACEILEEAGLKPIPSATGAECLAKFDQSIGLALLDVHLPDFNGIELMRELSQKYPRCKFLMMTGDASPAVTIQAMQSGASNFVYKPFDSDYLLAAITEHLDPKLYQMDDESILLSKSKSPAVIRLLEMIRRVGPKNASVIIHGESGSGKEFIARLLHQLSARSEGPFVPVNCPAIPEPLLESELFGHKKGAFTGADRDKEGLFTAADHGTLFLDEVADFSLQGQVKVLRVLQERMITPVGSVEAKKVDFRVVAATSQDLRDKMEKGAFRSDLFYRLADLELVVPPLRDRLVDLPILVDNFSRRYAAEHAEEPRTFSPGAIAKLSEYHWPGNLRELRSFVRRVCILNPCETILPEHIRSEFLAARVEREELPTDIASESSSLSEGGLREALSENKYNSTKTAKALGISRSTLYRYMKKYDIR